VNIVVESTEPFVEERWVDRELQLGSTRLRVVERVPRCRMIDIRQDGLEPGSQWLKPLAQERGMSLAVYADVSQPGRIRLGDQPHRSSCCAHIRCWLVADVTSRSTRRSRSRYHLHRGPRLSGQLA
jgi:hypothetical protein